jgi:hypothetical protein
MTQKFLKLLRKKFTAGLASRETWGSGEVQARDWATCAGADALVAAVPLHAEDSHRSLAAWVELALRFCRAKSKGEEPPVTAAWLAAAVCGSPHENAIVVIRSLREIKTHEDYVPRRGR